MSETINKVAFIFPGQGAQTVGMLSEAVESFPIVRQTFDEASEALGFDLLDVCLRGPEAELNQTAITQPAILTASVALWRNWLQLNGRCPDFVAGHSLGEYAALVASESLRFLDAVKLVRARGELMQAAVASGDGAMAAILGLDDADVIAACGEVAAGDVVQAVNFNAPLQVVIAGNSAAVERAINACKSRGAKKAMLLPVSVPSHCLLMRQAARELADYLGEMTFNEAVIPIVQNVDASLQTAPDAIIERLVQQLYSPVRWSQSISLLAASGVTHLVECGPGKILAGLNKRIDKSLCSFGIETPATLASAVEALA